MQKWAVGVDVDEYKLFRFQTRVDVLRLGNILYKTFESNYITKHKIMKGKVISHKQVEHINVAQLL